MRKINIHSLIFICVAAIASIVDIIIYLFKSDYNITLAAVTVFCVIAAILICKWKKVAVKTDFSAIDLIFFAIIASYIVARIAIPNFFYDVNNYHIYLQDNPFANKIYSDYHAGNIINGFLFPLGDRMYYIFRHLLGLRAGTIFSFYCYIVVYYQVKEILSVIAKDKGKGMISLAAIICITASRDVIYYIGTYYIDILTIAILGYLASYFIRRKEHSKLELFDIIYLAILSGFACAIKAPNVVFAAIIILYYMIMKRIRARKNYFYLMIILGVIPIAPYMADNYIQTGSIMFPYYNSVFQSPYFAKYNWYDSRFHVTSFLYLLVWPIYIGVFNLQYGDGGSWYDIIWALGFIGIPLILRFYSKRPKELTRLCILSLILTVVWIAFTKGYWRYGLIIPIFYMINIMGTLLNVINIKIDAGVSRKALRNVFILLSCIAFIANGAMSMPQQAKNNVAYLFRDYENTKIHIDGEWGTFGDDTALTVMVREEGTPIVNLNVPAMSESELGAKLTRERIEGKTFYVLIDNQVRDYYVNKYETATRMNIRLSPEPLATYTVEDLPYLSAEATAWLYTAEYVGDFGDGN